MSYEFTCDWVGEKAEKIWRPLLEPYVNKPDVRFLEVGSYEGRSAVWWVDNILTGPGAALVCLDMWKPYTELLGTDWAAVSDRFHRNILACRDPSVVRVRYMPAAAYAYGANTTPGLFDFIYIDGDHTAMGCLTDAVACWPLLKVGGIMLFDDYDWEPPKEWARDDCPQTAARAFTTCLGFQRRRDQVALAEPLPYVEMPAGQDQLAIRKLR